MTNQQETMWTKVQAHYAEANFLQSPEWAEVNTLIGHQAIIETVGEFGWCLMLVKNAKRGRYLEVPGGPLIDWQDEAQVKQMFEQIKAVGKREKCVFVRLRPQLRKTEENLRLLGAQGCKLAPMHLHAEHTVILDLAKSEEELLAEMRRQTRYEVRKADKLGLKSEWGNDEQLFREFYAVQQETAERQHFIPPDEKMLLAERTAFGKQTRIYTVKTADNQVICYGLILVSGAEGEYFEAASTSLGREFPGAYALLWRVMRDLKAMGIKRFNLWGIAPPGQTEHRYAGVTTFKKGFGGEVVEFIPAQDIVLKKFRYLLNLVVEKIRKKMRHL